MPITETEFIRRSAFFEQLKGDIMTKHLSSDNFLERFDAIWQKGPAVRYQNPDAWIEFLYRKTF